jgi:rubrerythrin
MALNEKEKLAIQDLQSQEQTCIEKYKKYGNEAKDPVLKDLFQQLEQKEQQHYDSLEQVLSGKVPECDCNDQDGSNYCPQATYDVMSEAADKKADAFLATDCISTEKMVSSSYNTNVFTFADSCIRKLLADIQIEEQNHAEMLYKYKTANGMA